MAVESARQFWPAYLRVQADRCQRLSRNCMDLGTAGELRLMAAEYTAEAVRMDAAAAGVGPG